MRRAVLPLALLLLCCYTPAAFEESITSNLDRDGFRLRLVALPLGEEYERFRTLLWASVADQKPSFRGAVELPFVVMGPLSLRGALREVRAPHPQSASTTSWREQSELALDASTRPLRRRGGAFRLPDGRYGPLTAHLGGVREEDGDLAVAVLGLSGEGTGAAELTGVRATPAPPEHSADSGWFGMPHTPFETYHFLTRFAFVSSAGPYELLLAPACGASLSQAVRPGLWGRTALSYSQSWPAGNTLPEVDTHMTAVLTATTPEYRLPFGVQSADAVAGVVRLSLSSGSGGAQLDLRLASRWRPEMSLPGVPLTVRGLVGGDRSVRATVFSAPGRLRLDAEWGLGAPRHDDVPTMESSAAVSVQPAWPPLTGDCALRVSHERQAGLPLTWTIGLTGRWEVLRWLKLEYSATAAAERSAEAWQWDYAARARIRAKRNSTRYHLAVTAEQAGLGSGKTEWDLEFGWARAATALE